MLISVADYIAQTLADRGIRHIFLVTGGGAMFLNNAIGNESRLQYICTHHEQAAAMAAECYARVSDSIGVVNVTTGPGGINALNGVFGAWTDSVPMLVISGQVKRATLMAAQPTAGLRQLGDQEVDIISMVKGVTKYSVLVTDPADIRYHLERALYVAFCGRPGPCWLDIPVDVQSSLIDPEKLIGYEPDEHLPVLDLGLVTETIKRLKNAKRPVILAGTGVRASGALELFQRAVAALGIPVTTAWTHDLLPSDDPHFCGRPGTIGERAGNFTVQNADVLLILGSRLNIRQVSYNWEAFARHAYKIWVDIDAAELSKTTVQPDLPIHCNLYDFLHELLRQLPGQAYNPKQHANWLAWCKQRLRQYPVVQPKHREYREGINAYHFMEVLFDQLRDDDVVVCGDATACIVPYQVAKLKKHQRLISNSGSASMGYDLPAAVGAAVARGGKRVICLAGDGSIQLNIQELQTIIHHRLPITIFVLNNGGYLSIRSTQKNFFGKEMGCGPNSGVSFPDMVRIARAYGIAAVRILGPDFDYKVNGVLCDQAPILAEVYLDTAQTFEPRLSSKQLPDGRIVTAPLEDMFPFLPREELQQNLLIPAVANE